jgi:HTH-type transcriptional regulator/antitoxin HigA
MAIHDSVAYGNAMEYIDALTSIPKPTRGQQDYLESLSVLVGDYEDKRWEDVEISPVEIIRALMEEHAMTASDLGRLLGDRNLGGRILAGTRALSKNHVRKLADYFGVKPGLFI